MNLFYIKLATAIMLFFACSKPTEIASSDRINTSEEIAQLTYLALGDSYTIGESLTVKNSFPRQLEKRLEGSLNVKIKTEILAKTGWRTDNLLDAISAADLNDSYDFVTLLIGVNNQYQGTPFSKYEAEFPKLLAKAIAFAGNNPKRVIVVSIPDWSYTPFGKNREEDISSEIDAYNAFAKLKTEESKVLFTNITDITREGLDKPILVAGDGLHPSKEAYQLFVDRIAPNIASRLKD